jgi:hypothetical protein
MTDYLFQFLREVALPVVHLGGLTLIGTFVSKHLVKAWQKGATLEIWSCLWALAICISSACARGRL